MWVSAFHRLFTYMIDLADLKLIGQSQISHSVCFSLTSVCGRKASRSIESAHAFGDMSDYFNVEGAEYE